MIIIIIIINVTYKEAISLPPGVCWWLKFQWMSLALIGDRKGVQPQ